MLLGALGFRSAPGSNAHAHGVHHRSSLALDTRLISSGCSHRVGETSLKLINIDLARSRILDDSYQRSLQILNLLSTRKQLLQIIVETLLGETELLVLMLDLTDSLVELLVLSVNEIEFFLSPFDISQKVRLGLVRLLCESLVELDFSSLVLDLVLQSFDFDSQRFAFLLLLLEAVSQKETLLNSTFGGGRSIGDRLNQSVADIVGSTAINFL